MDTKLKIEKMADAINYLEVQKTFYKGNGNELTFDDLLKLGKNEEDYPFTIREFKKLGYALSRVDFQCYDNNNDITYILDNKDKTIVIDCNNFTLKECFIIINMIMKHLDNIGPGQFISFGNANDKTHSLFHEEATAYGMWWEDFHNIYVNRLKSKNKLSQIQIFTEDYQTDDKRYYTKDRVIKIVLF